MMIKAGSTVAGSISKGRPELGQGLSARTDLISVVYLRFKSITNVVGAIMFGPESSLKCREFPHREKATNRLTTS